MPASTTTVLLAVLFSAIAQGQLPLRPPSRISATVVDSAGDLYIAGSVYEDILPVTPVALQRSLIRTVCNGVPCSDAFVAKISADGSRFLFATYLGGNGDDEINAITVDPNGNPIVAGSTTSIDFPVTKDAYRTTPGGASGTAFVTKLNPFGTALLASTYIGGMIPRSVVTDSQGSIFVAGLTGMRAFGVEGFRSTPGTLQAQPLGASDGTVVKLDGLLRTVAYATLLGGSLGERVSGIAVDTEGHAYLTGETDSIARNVSGPGGVPFPVTAGALRAESGMTDVFVAKLNPAGSALVYSAVFGTPENDAGLALAIDNTGAAYVAGLGLRGYPSVRGDVGEGFLAAVSSDGRRLFYTARIPGGPRSGNDAQYSIRLGPSRTLLIKGALEGATQTTPDSLGPCRREGDFLVALDADSGSLRYGAILDRVLAISSGGEVRLPGSAGGLLTVSANVLEPLSAQVTCIANAADFIDGPIAPGEIVSLFGSGIGPDQPISWSLHPAGYVPAHLGGVLLTFNGIVAAILYASKHQLNAVVPLDVARLPSAHIRIVRNEQHVASLERLVVPTAPAIFGGATPALLNEDGTLNSAGNPARAGSIVSTYMTGAGKMEPVPLSGSLGEGKTRVAAPVRFFTSSPELVVAPESSGEVLYAGDAPGFIQGAVQINVRLPSVQDSAFRIVIGDRSTPWTPIFITAPTSAPLLQNSRAGALW